ncbi:MAG: SLC13 family permease [Caulobacterales bacterium]|jgi:di/tricarboxylate transporter
MTGPQIVALSVLAAVVAALVWGKLRADIVALSGAAVLLATRTVRPVEVQAAFASPAIVALASLFVIAYAMELSGLLGLVIRGATKVCARFGAAGVWGLIGLTGVASAFLNNTPLVILAAPVVRDVATSMKLPPKRFLIPVSYAAVLGGACTLIGTSTNLLVNDMARNAGQQAFGIFEITPVGVIVALTGALYLMFVGGPMLGRAHPDEPSEADASVAVPEIAAPSVAERPYRPVQAFTALAVFLGVVVVAATGYAPIAACAFTGAVLLVLLRVISAEDAYKGLRPEILLLIAGMVVVGLSLQLTGLAALATAALGKWVVLLGPRLALALLYGATLLLTEILSNAAVAVLVTPVAVALAESLGVSPRPFLVAVMMAASAAFATPFGYQTNVLVYQLGRYRYLDFVKVGLPLNLLTWLVALLVIPVFFPF